MKELYTLDEKSIKDCFGGSYDTSFYIINKSLNIKEENSFRISVNNQNLYIEFYEPGKFNNSYVEFVTPAVKMIEKKDKYYFYDDHISNNNFDLKLYLPSDKYYNFAITNKNGKCTIINGYNIYELDIDAKEVELINTSVLPHGDIESIRNEDIIVKMTNSSIANISGNIKSLELNKSNIYNILSTHQKIYIEKNNSNKIKPESFYLTGVNIFGEDNSINNIKANNVHISLKNSNIGQINSNYGNLFFDNCTFQKNKNISLNNGYVLLKSNDNYKIKTQQYKNKSNAIIYDKDSNKKLMKIKILTGRIKK